MKLQGSVHREIELRIMQEKGIMCVSFSTWSDRISELFLCQSDLLKVYVLPLPIHNSISVIPSSHSSTRTLLVCLNNNCYYFTFIPKLNCNQIITYFIHRYTFTNNGLYHICITIVHNMGFPIVRTLKAFDLCELA